MHASSEKDYVICHVPQRSTMIDIEHVSLLMNEFIGVGRETLKLPNNV